MFSKVFTPAVAAALLSTLVSADSSCSVKKGVTLTSYGSGSTPGKVVYPNFMCSPGSSQTITAQPGSVQGGENNVITSGDGSWNNPATMATALDNPQIKPCQIVYVPWLRKYFKFADRCEQCTTDLASGTWHLDLWTGLPPSSYDAGKSSEQGTCESKWGSSTHDIVLNPGPNLPVSTDPMDDGNTCYSPLDSTKRVFEEGGDSCSGAGSGSGSGNGGSSSAAPAVASPTAAAQYTPPTAPSPSPSPASSSSAAAAPIVPPVPTTLSTVVVPSPSSSSSSSSSPASQSSSSSGSGSYTKEKDTKKEGSGGTCSTYNDCNPGNKDTGKICVCGQCVRSDSSDFGHCKMYGRGLRGFSV